MGDIEIKINRKKREVKPSKIFIGLDGENLQENVIFSFEDEFVQGQARLDIEFRDGTKGQITELEQVGETYVLPIKSEITKYSGCIAQLVIDEGTDENSIPIFKSLYVGLIVGESINATTPIPERYIEWIERANAKLNQIDSKIEEVDTAVEQVNNAVERVDEGLRDLTHANEEAREIVSNFEDNVESYTNDFNTNANNKTSAFNSNYESKLSSFNSNASEKTTAFNDNADSKLSSYNSNASSKLSEYNSNAETKKSDYDTNASSKLNEYNTNATTKLGEYNTNASNKLEEYNQNASDKITEYDEHVAEMQDTINKLEVKVEDLENNQLFNEVEGTNINITDAHNTRAYDFVLEKESSQKTTTGKNLNSSVLEQGSISSTTGENTIGSQSRSKDYILVEPNTEYTVSSSIQTTIGVRCYDINKTFLSPITGSAQPKTFTTPNDCYYVRFTVVNSDLTNLVQLEKGNQATSYEEYTGGQPSPNPDYPQEVKTVKGYRNLIDDSIKYGAVNNVYMGTSASETKLFKAGTYTISTNYPCTIQVLSSEGTKSSDANSTDFTFTLSEDDNIRIRFQKNGIQPSDITFVLIVEGTEVKPYVPYGNNYVNVKVKGKNLLNINNEYIKRNNNGSMTISDNVITLTNSTSTNNAYGWILPVEINKEITISFDNINPIVTYATVYYAFIQEPISSITDLSLGNIIDKTQKYVTVTSTTKYLLIYIRVPQTTFTVSNLMVSYSNDLKYEPYQETTVPIPLNNNEIAGIGNYLDELIVDKSGNIFINKKIGKYIFTGNETFTSSAGLAEESTRFNMDFNDIYTDTNPQSNIIYILSNYFLGTTWNKIYVSDTTNKNLISNYNNTNSVHRISIRIDSEIASTIQEFQTYLQTQYSNETPVIAYYVKTSPDLINLNATVDIRLFKYVNNITNSEDGKMKIRYVQGTQTVIDEIKNAIVSLGGEI